MTAVEEKTLADSMTRFSKFNRPEPRDAVRILGPVLEGICLDHKAPAERATEWLNSQSPEAITEETVRAFVASVTEIPADTLAVMRAKQDQLEKELAAEKPLTARDKALLERQQPLAERSRQSILDEIYEAEHCRTRDGVELPDLSYEQWRALDPHFDSLRQELAQRDCRAYGVKYVPPTKRDHALDMVPSMRG